MKRVFLLLFFILKVAHPKWTICISARRTHSAHSWTLDVCHMAKCLCEKGSWQTRGTACDVIVPELTYKTNILRKKSPRCKLVSLSACNFLHCLFCCCALKIWYLVLPRGCIIVNSPRLSHSCLSISPSPTVQCKCLSSCWGNKASWQLSRSGSLCYCSSCHSLEHWHLQTHSHHLSLTVF